MDDEDFLAAVEADNINAPAEDAPEPPKAEEPKQEPVQSAPAEAAPVEPATPTEPPVVPEAPKHPEPGYVPIAAMLDARDKAKALEAELAQFRAAQQQAQQQVQIPDQWEDPEGHAAYQQAAFQTQVLSAKLDLSEEMARSAHGDQIVDEAREWALKQYQAKPGFRDEVLGQRNPYGYVVQQFKRDQIASQVTPDEFQQFQAWKTAQSQLQQQQAAPAAPPNSAPSIPPRSLASAPSAGGVLSDVVQSDDEIFDEVIGKR